MFFSLASFAALGLLGSASALVTRDAPGANEKFGLYAYGDAIGGLSLFYAGGANLLTLKKIECILRVIQARP